MDDRVISKAVISRLPRYFRYLGDLMRNGVERISSKELSEMMKVTASQIRQDLNTFGGFGQQGYGYNVKYLYDEIAKILGVNHKHHMIIIGAGNLARSLANYTGFNNFGYYVIGLFDHNPALKGITFNGIPIRMLDELPDFLTHINVSVAALAVPKHAAHDVAQFLIDNGIKAIWNFVQTDLEIEFPENVVVQNVHLSDSLMQLSYAMTVAEREAQQ